MSRTMLWMICSATKGTQIRLRQKVGCHTTNFQENDTFCWVEAIIYLIWGNKDIQDIDRLLLDFAWGGTNCQYLLIYEYLERQEIYRLVRFHLDSDYQATLIVDFSAGANPQLNGAYVLSEVARGKLDVNQFMQITEHNWITINVYSWISPVATRLTSPYKEIDKPRCHEVPSCGWISNVNTPEKKHRRDL